MQADEIRRWKCAHCRATHHMTDTDDSQKLPENCPDCGASHPWYLDAHRKAGNSSEPRKLSAPMYARMDYWQKFSTDGPAFPDKGAVEA